jgi:two-component system NtrC family response regulator
MNNPRILIVDDDDDVRTQAQFALQAHFDVILAADRTGALARLKEDRPPLVMLDLGLPPFPDDTREGFLTLAEMLQVDPLVKVLVITGQGEGRNGVEAIGHGAYDFFSKPMNVEELKVVLYRAFHVQQLERRRREFSEGDPQDSFEGILGDSPQIQRLFGTLEKVSGTAAPVLILGESGTGKELVAKAIHRRSSRTGPFVPVNCSAIPANLFENELFGHEQGAFAGAPAKRLGRIEAAHGGTLFLDEVEQLSPAIQVKLMRFLQDHKIERVGGLTSVSVGARILAATNVDLAKAMMEGRFREDLYYRLAVLLVSLPPLREREGDIPLLAEACLRRQVAQNNKSIAFTAKAIQAMNSYSWPGNVAELENRIQRAAIMAEGGQIMPDDLGISEHTEHPEHTGQRLGKARRMVERQMVESALSRNNGNVTRAAAELEISRPSLYELIEKLGIVRT